jgi:hypothetical protein
MMTERTNLLPPVVKPTIGKIIPSNGKTNPIPPQIKED